MAWIWPSWSAACSRACVTSVATLTILRTAPSASFKGAYTAWIHTSRPDLVRRRNTWLNDLPAFRSAQKRT